LRVSSFINQKKAEVWLARNLRKKFGKDAVIAIGDCLAPMYKFHKLIRNVGMRRILWKHESLVCLIDKYKMSSLCS
ncbi:hypothetical protein BX070DRAFT_191920, partial [Coemansia spiralis]